MICNPLCSAVIQRSFLGTLNYHFVSLFNQKINKKEKRGDKRKDRTYIIVESIVKYFELESTWKS